ncbi:MAG: hypothetical protein IK117_09385 [Bacteroidales bacterium]|nr:hypothetical protein [Bacteroidales bacterium]
MGKQTTIKVPLKTERYEIFAICSNLNVFQFCATLNNLLSIDLQGQKPREIEINGIRVQPLHYSFVNPIDKVTTTVVENQVNGRPLLDYLKNITFFVKLSPVVSDEQLTDFQQKLSESGMFTFVQRISRQNFTKQQENTFNAIFQYV